MTDVKMKWWHTEDDGLKGGRGKGDKIRKDDRKNKEMKDSMFFHPDALLQSEAASAATAYQFGARE